MGTKSIRVLLVVASPAQEGQLRSLLDQVLDVELVGIAQSMRAALTKSKHHNLI
jgi:acetolactate synthase regulatory subunit